MASSDAKPFPQKNVAYRVTFPIFDNDGDLVTGAAGLDSEVSKDGAAFADCTNEATEIATASGMYYLDLTSTEMNADTVAVIVKTSTTDAKTTPMVFYPEEAGDIRVNVTQVNGTSQTAGDIPAMITAVDDYVDSEVSAIKAKTDQLTFGTANRVDAQVYGVETAAITAGSIATDAIGAAELAADAVTEIWAASTAPTAAAIADAVWDEDATAHQTQGTFGQAIGDPVADSDTIWGLVNTNLNATISSRASQTSVDTIDDLLDSEIGALTTELAKVPKSDSNVTWNATAAAQIQSEANDALVAYDPPTHAELTSGLASADDATLAAIAALNNLSAAQVNAEVDTALADINLDHLVKSAVDTNFATTVHLDSVIGQLADNGTSATFDRTTDSLEALQAEHDSTQTKIDTVDDFLDTEIAAIKAKTDNLPASPANEATLTTIAGYLDTEIAAILADTNELQTDWANGGRLDLILDARASQTSVDDLPTNAELATALGTADDATLAAIAALSIPTAATIADAVWDEDATAHQTQGTFGQAIGDPVADADSIWSLVNTNLDAAVSSRASQTSLDTVDDFLDTEIAAIKAKTDNLPTDPADQSAVEAAITAATSPLATAAALDTVDNFLDTEIAAIKAKTDSLTFTVAGQVDSNIQYVNDVAVTGTGAVDDEWGPA